MTDRTVFSQHFDNLKSDIIAGVGELSKLMARFAGVHTSRSHLTKQLREIASAEFQSKIVAFDATRALAKKMYTDAARCGLSASDTPQSIAVVSARVSITTELSAALGEWRAVNEAGWNDENTRDLLNKLVARTGRIRTTLKNLRDTSCSLRTKITAHLNSRAFRDFQATPECKTMAAELTKAATARTPPTIDEDDDEDEEGAGAVDLGDEDSIASGDDLLEIVDGNGSESPESSDDSLIVDDDEDDDDDVSDTCESESQEPPPRVMPARKRKLETIAKIREIEAEIRQANNGAESSSSDSDDSDESESEHKVRRVPLARVVPSVASTATTSTATKPIQEEVQAEEPDYEVAEF